MEKYTFSEEQLEQLQGLPMALAVYQYINHRITTLVVSKGFCKLFGFQDPEAASGKMDLDMYGMTHPQDVARVKDAALRFATKGGTYDVVYRTKYHGGDSYRVVHANGELVSPEEGVQLAYVWYLDEGVYEKEPKAREGIFRQSVYNALHQDELPREEQHDQLTGLPGKGSFFRLAHMENQAARKTGGQQAFLFFDLNGMKYYNTKYTFAEGDRLLRSFGRLLSKTFGNDCCCHLGGDHFAAFSKAEGLEDVLKNMFAECKGLNSGNSLPVHTGISIDRKGDLPGTISCDRAKLACDLLRDTYDSCFGYYNETLSDDIAHRRYILSHFDQALEEEWIQVYYQPIVRAVSEDISDEEALARWVDPEKGVLSPAMFIPILEEARLIYKLDLYMLDQILKKLKLSEEAGLFLVAQSLNLSRCDFDACDMVEEIRKRVDASGFRRDLITIEITESTIGQDYEFMKKQVERFQALGFPVWMDDFGSGYSSLDILQSIRFDLIKFDMSFMKRLDEGVNSKIVLTELMKMATALGVDTVCEGVETVEQKQFLQEIGCAKLQGYLFAKPNPLSLLLSLNEKGIKIRYENPEEADYYENVGRISLYDLDMISQEEGGLRNYFNTLPMAVMEIKDEEARFIRTNPSYRFFAKRFLGFDLYDEASTVPARPAGQGEEFMRMVRQSCRLGHQAFVDEKLEDGSVIHSFIRKIGENPITGKTAVAIAVLSAEDKDPENTCVSIARTMAPDYYYTCYVNLETDEYIEFTSATGRDGLKVEFRGKDFFGEAREEEVKRFAPEDREEFLKVFTKENILQHMAEAGTFEVRYRIMENGRKIPLRMQVMRLNPEEKHLIIGVSLEE